MDTFALSGAVTSAFTHFALAGLAGIIADSRQTNVRIWWSNESAPRPLLSCGLPAPEAAALVREHAARQAASSWMNADVVIDGTVAAVFSPRVKLPRQRVTWALRQEEQHRALDQLDHSEDAGAARLLSSLGQPAYWRYEKGEPRPDDGASRLEMKTRNRGEEFITHRLRPLASTVAALTDDQIHDGLFGGSAAVGNLGSTSRIATGLTLPGPQHEALAWCALWGISAFGIAHHISTISTTAAVESGRTHPRWLALPVFTRPTSLARYRNVLFSDSLAACGIFLAGRLGIVRSPGQPHSDERPRSHIAHAEIAVPRLRTFGVEAVSMHKIQKAGSASAPERQVLYGQVEPLQGLVTEP